MQLVAVFLLLCHAAASEARVYYVGTDIEDSCNGYSPCHTLQHYASSQKEYFTNSTSFKFLSGNHTLQGNMLVHEVRSLTLESNSEETVIIECNDLGGFIFHHVFDLKLQSLAFVSCGQPLPTSLRKYGGTAQAAIAFQEVTGLSIEALSVTHSAGYGILGRCVYGNFSISKSTFSSNRGSTLYLGGNAAIEYINCSASSISDLKISLSNFTDGYYEGYNFTHYSGTLATGLSVILSQSNVNLLLSNVNVARNRNSKIKGIGGNMFVHFINQTTHISCNITIENSIIVNGTSCSGAGIIVSFYTSYLPPSQQLSKSILHPQQQNISQQSGFRQWSIHWLPTPKCKPNVSPLHSQCEKLQL